MNPISITEVLEVIEGQLLHGDTQTPFTGYTTDSRSVKAGDLYIPINGRWYDGNDFIADVFVRGASWSLVSDLSKIPLGENLDDKGLIFVDDTLEALQKLAAHHLEKRNSPDAAVTGNKRNRSKRKMRDNLLRILQEEC